ncbi:endo-1,4-beta-xylanase [Rhodanobacter sp. 115]|uniref:endo-1,4-beta-xylanase n=1 Tax=Rhodanobacter sp. FW021-MT20 TaxID=1162282 RepID=UPI000260E800|nr:endo-1,4-beta-xylanase [Rhodanobacter sp. 115]EIL96080.1 glycosyl transferase family protein [Rhodanobacter sp. 115]
MKSVRTILVAALIILAATALHARDVPLATGLPRFLGCAYSPAQARDFTAYWNKVTPENAGKWGSVEAVRGHMDWRALDAAYHFAKSHGFPFQMHVLVWGNQQPEWIKHLPPAEQRRELEHWFAAVAQRYPDLDYVGVVNEALNDPPSKDDKGGGNYIAALGGNGASGWDWVLESYRLARRYFPHAKLLINDYNVINKAANTRRYRTIIDLLQREHLLDGIGVQAHAFETAGVPAATLRANLDTLATTGLPIYITEMDIDGPTDAAQLKEYQRVFPVFWDDPAVKGITLWGFRPGLWRNKERAYLVRRNGSERPALRWLRGYVRGVTGSAK